MSDLTTFVADAKTAGIASLSAALTAVGTSAVSEIPKLEGDAATCILDLVPSAVRPLVAGLVTGQAPTIDAVAEAGVKAGIAWALARLQAL